MPVITKLDQPLPSEAAHYHFSAGFQTLMVLEAAEQGLGVQARGSRVQD